MVDLLIKNAELYDGSGAAAFRADLAVKNGKIVQIGRVSAEAERTVDAKGLALAPGFIDSHTHADVALYADPHRTHVLQMGVTTEVAGNCGHSTFPILPSVSAEEFATMTAACGGEGVRFQTLAAYRRELERLEMGPNQTTLAGHCVLRGSVMGLAGRAPTQTEMQQMKELLELAMAQGAQGYSSGLGYIPSAYADKQELTELAKVAAKYGGIYTTHSRWESASMLKSVQECIDISREAEIPVQISHLKCTGKDFWNDCEKALELIERGNRSGACVTFDAYPYSACSTSATTAVIPAHYFEHGMGAFLRSLEDAQVLRQLRREIYEIDDPGWDNGALHVGLENFLIVGAERTPQYVGKTYTELAESWGVDGFDAMLRVLKENDGVVREVRYTMCEENVEAFLHSPLCSVGSDGIYVPGRDSVTHPRAIGTFPRYLGRYIRERKILSREEGIHRLTGMPARRFGLAGKGFLKEGYDADLVLFDYDTITDHADFNAPFLQNEGIHQVYMEGKLVLEDNKPTGTWVGKYLPRAKL